MAMRQKRPLSVRTGRTRPTILIGLLVGLATEAPLLGTGLDIELRSSQALDLAPDRSLRKEALHAIQVGVAWLEENQREDGSWSNPSYPALTALAVSAILHAPQSREGEESYTPSSATRGLEFLVSRARPDGGIYQPVSGIKGGGLPNYNTAIALMAFADARSVDFRKTIADARAFLVRSQHRGEDVFDGGMGYDSSTERDYADLCNTLFALEALRTTEQTVRDQGGDTAPKLDWDAAIEFVSRCQHSPLDTSAAWQADATRERGGFIYHPEKSMAGEVESSDGSGTYLRSYGGMTYTGLLSFLYARVDREDPRVVAAHDWIRQNWTVEENPGMGSQGLYYYYHTLAKALHVYGEEVLALPSGEKAPWRKHLIEKLVSLQRIDPKTGLGYWTNDTNRWWENDPNLATAYALLALEIALLEF